jgi:hypothetical protein
MHHYDTGIHVGSQIQDVFFLMFLIHGFDMIVRYKFDTHELGVMTSIWFCYVFDMVWVQSLGYGLDMVHRI